jgi:hypothetical protein
MDQHINLLTQPDEDEFEMRVALVCVLILEIEDSCMQRAHHHNKSWL